MTDSVHTRGETVASFQPSTMSTFEARAFASSDDPEQEIRELSEDAEHGSINARIRIGGLLTSLGPERWREARGYWLAALEECEWLLGDYYEPRSVNRAASAGSDQYLLETAAGAISGMLGELALQLDREKEAIAHLERGVHYRHSESSLRLALLYKARGRLDLAQFLLTSVLEDPAHDAAYLLGDLFRTKGNTDLALDYHRRAAAHGHRRAATHIPAGDTNAATVNPRLEEEISYGHSWRAVIDHLDGGVVILWEDKEIFQLEVSSNLSGIDMDIISTSPDIYEELETHRTMVRDHQARTFAVRSAEKSALVRDNSTTIYQDAHVDVGILDLRSKVVELHSFKTVRHAMEFLRILAPLSSG